MKVKQIKMLLANRELTEKFGGQLKKNKKAKKAGYQYNARSVAERYIKRAP
jgi:hypothetical protein